MSRSLQAQSNRAELVSRAPQTAQQKQSICPQNEMFKSVNKSTMFGGPAKHGVQESVLAGKVPVFPENKNQVEDQNNFNLSFIPILHSAQAQAKTGENTESFGSQQSIGNNFAENFCLNRKISKHTEDFLKVPGRPTTRLGTNTERSLHNGVQEGNILAGNQHSFVSLGVTESDAVKVFQD